MLEDVFEEILRIYKAKPQELTVETLFQRILLAFKKFLGFKPNKVLFGEITLFFNTWKIIFQKTSDSYSISAIPDLPAFKHIDQKMIKKWELISESNGRFSYSGPIFGKQMKKYILEALEKYPTKVAIAREAIKRALMSPEISELYAFYKFKKTEP